MLTEQALLREDDVESIVSRLDRRVIDAHLALEVAQRLGIGAPVIAMQVANLVLEVMAFDVDGLDALLGEAILLLLLLHHAGEGRHLASELAVVEHLELDHEGEHARHAMTRAQGEEHRQGNAKAWQNLVGHVEADVHENDGSHQQERRTILHVDHAVLLHGLYKGEEAYQVDNHGGGCDARDGNGKVTNVDT